MIATVAATCLNVGSSSLSFSVTSLVCFLLANNVSMDTAFFFLFFYSNTKCPAGSWQVKINLLLMKQEANKFLLNTIYNNKKKKKLKGSQACTQVSSSSTSITPELQGVPGWNYHQTGKNLLFAGCGADLCSSCLVTAAESLAGQSSDRDTHSSSLTPAESHLSWLNCRLPRQTPCANGLRVVSRRQRR